MSKIDEQVAKIIETEKTKFESQSEYKKLIDFLQKAEGAGLIKKHTYSIPQPDTIGKKLRDSIKARLPK